MTVATTEPGALAQTGAPIAHTEATMSLVGWSTELDAAYNLATMICNTAFVPQHFKGKPEETAVAMLYGHTLGLPPMVAVKSIYVVHGAPALYAQTMYALALSMGHQIERVHADDQRVEFRAKRRGQQVWQKVEWSIERARKAKYTSNGKYQENPIGMLTEKCKAEAAKLVAPDVLAGLNSVEEIELGDYDDSPTEETPAAEKPAATKVTRKRKTPSNAAPEPVKPAVVDAPIDEGQDEPEAEEATEAEPMVTQEQWNDAKAALASVGITTPAAIKDTLTDVAGRPIAKWRDLTAAEATQVIEFVQQATEGVEQDPTTEPITSQEN